MKYLFVLISIKLCAFTALSADICNRSKKAQEAINRSIYEKAKYENSKKAEIPLFKDCSEIPDEALAGINNLYIFGISTSDKLQKDDLKGLFNLRRLDMAWFAADDLPKGYLDDLKELREFIIGYGGGIHAGGEGLVSVDPEIFKNNTKLVSIDIRNNKFATLPDNIFSHLSKLLVVKVSYNFKTPTGASGDYYLRGLHENIFNNAQTQNSLYRPNDEYYSRYPLNPAPKFNSQSHAQCGVNGTIEERAKDCNLVRSVEGKDGNFYQWRLISSSKLGFETWQDMHSKLMWSDISKSYLSVARLREAGSNNANSYLCVPSDKESLEARNINSDKWRLPSEADFLSAHSRGMYEALPRIYGDFNKVQTNHVLAERVKWGYVNGHHGGSYVWMNWMGFNPATELVFFYAKPESTHPSLNPKFPYLMEPDTLLAARSWNVRVDYRCVSDVL